MLEHTQWILADFDVYQGKHPHSNQQYQREFGKCVAPIISMLVDLTSEKRIIAIYSVLKIFGEKRQRYCKGTPWVFENVDGEHLGIRSSGFGLWTLRD